MYFDCELLKVCHDECIELFQDKFVTQNIINFKPKKKYFPQEDLGGFFIEV
jgi:hypothetical protein